MASADSETEPDSGAPEPAELIRVAVSESHEELLRSVALLVSRSQRSLRWTQAMDRAWEILNEAVEQALKHADRFDPARSVTAWIRGISARIHLSRMRSDARGRRCVPATVLGSEAWSAALEQLLASSDDLAVASGIDLQQALARLSADDRKAVELRYFKGLDGVALASALGAPSTGAARVRVCRALQALRAQFPRPGEGADS